jgi:hypothetical protein
VTDAHKHETQPQPRQALDARARAQSLLKNMASPFVPNLGQWQHRGRFVHRAGPMTVFLEDRGWVLDLVERPAAPETRSRAWGPAMQEDRNVEQKTRGVALRMNFEGDTYVPEIVGEKKLPGVHNYFLGNDESRWRTDVPLYASVRYEDLYPGIDLRLREMNGVPEYDVLLQPGADLSLVSVHVEGGQGLSIASDGSLVIETTLGPLTQPKPKTWQVGADGRKREVACNFTLLGADRFGFLVPGWAGDTSLTIDPGLIWSTFLGGSRNDAAFAMSVDANGVVTVAGTTESSTGFPTTTGAYNRTWSNGTHDAVVSRLDPSKLGTAQLVYSTFLGGDGADRITALSVDANGVVTVAGGGTSTNFPTKGAKGVYDTTYNGGRADAFVSRLDPTKQGAAQLLYSTYLGGAAWDVCQALSVNASGVVTVAGGTFSTNFPTGGAKGAYDTTYNGGNQFAGDAFVSRLDPTKAPASQLVYSTFLGGASGDHANQLSVDTSGVVTVAGYSFFSSVTNLPTTLGAYSPTHNGNGDAFVSRLDPSKTGNAQLVYSTFLGGSSNEVILGLSVDNGIATVTGWTNSSNFPTTTGAYNTKYNGGSNNPVGGDAFVSRLILGNLGPAGLTYSTFLGGRADDYGGPVSVDANGVITVTGATLSKDFPTTPGAYDAIYNGGADVFVSRLDPNKSGSAHFPYSTFLGHSGNDRVEALSVDASGVVTVAGWTDSTNFPTTSGAYNTKHNGSNKPPTNGDPIGDIFVSRLGGLYGDVHQISISAGGTQKLTVDAGWAHAGRSYWIFGSVTGTTPGVTLGSAIGAVHIPLVPDIWTDITIGFANTPTLRNTKRTLNASGTAQASFNIPPTNLPSAIGLVFHHACLIYDAKNNFHMASNPVPLTLVK